MNFTLPSSDQVSSLLRHGYTAGGTVLTIAAMLAVIPQDSVQPAIAALHKVGDGLQTAFGGFSDLVVLLGPVVIGLSAKAAAFAVSLKSQVKSVHDAAPDQLAHVVSQVAPTTLARATASIEGVQVTVNSDARTSLRALAADPAQRDIVVAPPATVSSKKFQGL